jgi:hypothetical protein
MLRCEPPVHESTLEPAEENADTWLRHVRVTGDDDERAIARSNGLGHAEVRVGSQCAEPG